jgi:hypothetical protein
VIPHYPFHPVIAAAIFQAAMTQLLSLSVLLTSLIQRFTDPRVSS